MPKEAYEVKNVNSNPSQTSPLRLGSREHVDSSTCWVTSPVSSKSACVCAALLCCASEYRNAKACKRRNEANPKIASTLSHEKHSRDCVTDPIETWSHGPTPWLEAFAHEEPGPPLARRTWRRVESCVPRGRPRLRLSGQCSHVSSMRSTFFN